MQPVHRATTPRSPAGISRVRTMSETAKRPPGRSTRKASRRTASLSALRLMTQLEMTTSTEASGIGTSSIVPSMNRAFSMPASARCFSARASISSVMSRP